MKKMVKLFLAAAFLVTATTAQAAPPKISISQFVEHPALNAVMKLAFAASKFANRLKPLLAKGLRRTAILVVLLQNLVLFGRLNNPWWRFNFQ